MQTFDTSLPIDDALPDLAAALAGNNAAVLVAPPGAGKTLGRLSPHPSGGSGTPSSSCSSIPTPASSQSEAAGPINELRSIVTGWYRVDAKPDAGEGSA